MKIKSTVVGLRELDLALSELTKEYSGKESLEALKPALKEGVQEVYQDVKNNTPVDTGGLRDSTRIVVRKSNKKDKKTLGNDSVAYASVEWNWKKSQGDSARYPQQLAIEYGNSSTAARPVLRPALEKNAQNSVNVFGRTLGASIDKTARKLEKKYKPKTK